MKKLLSIFVLLPTLFFTYNLNASGYLMDPMPSHERAPEFSLIGMDEKVHTLKSLEGKFLLVNFWATWCNPCKAEMPTLEAIHKRFDNRGMYNERPGVILNNLKLNSNFSMVPTNIQ